MTNTRRWCCGCRCHIHPVLRDGKETCLYCERIGRPHEVKAERDYAKFAREAKAIINLPRRPKEGRGRHTLSEYDRGDFD